MTGIPDEFEASDIDADDVSDEFIKVYRYAARAHKYAYPEKEVGTEYIPQTKIIEQAAANGYTKKKARSWCRAVDNSEINDKLTETIEVDND